jgi:anti-sigma B factor antagonist
MAILLPYLLAGQSQQPVLKTPRHRGRKEGIPLLGSRTNRIDKPEIEIVNGENGTMARICGRIDIDTSPALRALLLTTLQGSHCNALILDLSAVTHIDSSGVATLIEGLRIARSHNIEVRLQGLEGRLLRLFQSTGILSLFNGSTPTNSQSGSKAV